MAKRKQYRVEGAPLHHESGLDLRLLVTAKDIADATGLPLRLVQRRLGKGERRWEVLAQSPRQAKRAQELAAGRMMAASRLADLQEKSEAELQQSRMQSGHKPMS